jgi:hypothetical protein
VILPRNFAPPSARAAFAMEARPTIEKKVRERESFFIHHILFCFTFKKYSEKEGIFLVGIQVPLTKNP